MKDTIQAQKHITSFCDKKMVLFQKKE